MLIKCAIVISVALIITLLFSVANLNRLYMNWQFGKHDAVKSLHVDFAISCIYEEILYIFPTIELNSEISDVINSLI